MKDLKQHILEKLNVSKNYFSDVTLESLLKVLKDYKDRKHYEFSAYIDLKEIFEECPVVLQYHGTYTDKNIIGEKIQAIQFIQYNTLYRSVMKNGKDAIFSALINDSNVISEIGVLDTLSFSKICCFKSFITV